MYLHTHAHSYDAKNVQMQIQTHKSVTFKNRHIYN